MCTHKVDVAFIMIWPIIYKANMKLYLGNYIIYLHKLNFKLLLCCERLPECFLRLLEDLGCLLGGYLPSTANENSKQIFVLINLIVFGICRAYRPLFLIERGIEVVSVVCNGDFVSDYCGKSLCLMFERSLRPCRSCWVFREEFIDGKLQ